jgi:hypothetical protein
MGKSVIIGDTPEAKAVRDARKARLRQLVTVGCALVRQRDAFVGSQLTKRELTLRHQLHTGARRYRDEAIEMLSDHPDLRDMIYHQDFARLRDAFSIPWKTRTKSR